MTTLVPLLSKIAESVKTPEHRWRVPLSLGLAIFGLALLLNQLDAGRASAQRDCVAWSLTQDGRSRFASWSPDGRTVLVNRRGQVVGDGSTRQVLSELWAVDAEGGQAVKLSDNAVQPAYSADGDQLAYLAFAPDEQWEARVLDLDSGRQATLGPASWRTPPIWVGETVAFARNGRVRLAEGEKSSVSASFPALPPTAQIRLSGDGKVAAWSDGAGLQVVSHPGEKPTVVVRDTQVLHFTWSPDGRRLAYVIADAGLSPSLWVADVVRGEQPVLLAQGRMEVFSEPSWSPDGRTLAFSRTPLGAATASESDIWLASVDGRTLRPLTQNTLEESNPVWSPDGRRIAFNRAGDVWLLDLTHSLCTARSPHGERAPGSPFTNPPVYQSTTIQHTPPLTIRVIHRAENHYRPNVPVGQIDVITFETYVKRVVRVEVPALWPAEAVKAQAVAARTYAWYHAERNTDAEWDVSDWVDYQVMGGEDQQRRQSDAAVDATRGQYIAYRGDPIAAFYSAENGCPTRSIDGVPYIQAVDDPVSFGEERRGHGWGMSQWGAYRWAERHGWGYQQILCHYYTDVTIELPSTGGPMPLGGVTLPWSDHFASGNRLHLAANASDEKGDVTAVGFYAITDTTTLIATDTVASDGWSAVWNVSSVSDTTWPGITLAVRVADGDGNVQSETEAGHIGLDRQSPTTTTAAIADAVTDTITVTLSSLSATDPGPASGVQMMAFSNDGWTWEGEDLHWQTGEVVEDERALNGRALRGLADIHDAGTWYGPYTYDLPPKHAYRAYFRLKTADPVTTAEVATLDVVDNAGTRLLGLRRLRGTDFRAGNIYQEFPVDFNYTDVGTAGLEFRVAFRSTADLYLDRVLIVGYPLDAAPRARWRLTPGEGPKTVTVKFIDGAGNVSDDLTKTVTLLDTSPPTGWRDFSPLAWSADGLVTCTVRVLDEISGLDVESAAYRFSVDDGVSWSDWLAAACSGVSGTTKMQTITASGVLAPGSGSATAHIEFRISDLKGHTSTAAYTLRTSRLYLPLVVRGLAGTSHLTD